MNSIKADASNWKNPELDLSVYAPHNMMRELHTANQGHAEIRIRTEDFEDETYVTDADPIHSFSYPVQHDRIACR
jgi:hypothetical protein